LNGEEFLAGITGIGWKKGVAEGNLSGNLKTINAKALIKIRKKKGRKNS